MATIAEIEAKLAKAQAAGDEPAAKAFRDRISILKATPSEIYRKIEKAKAAGDQPAVDALSAGLKINSEWLAEQAKTGPVAASPPAADEITLSTEADIAKFEAANPALAGQFKAGDPLPEVGSRMGYSGGGGKSGGAPLFVAEWKRPDTIGDTAAAMMEGPLAAAGAFAGGLTGGESPSRNFLANDPLTGSLPGPVLTGLGAIGDLGGAALSTVGAGISGATGLASELMPGQNAADELALAEDLTGMAMFAVPELAGASSIPARVAAAAPKAAPVAAVAPKLADDVAAAERLGIPVMRTDVKPPETAIGKIVQRAGESIPIAGTAGMRAKQAAARLEAVKSFIGEYVGDTMLPAIAEVTGSLLEKRGADLSRLTGVKTAVVDKLKGKGAVPVPKAAAEIDKQIAALSAQRLGELKPVIDKLNDFKRSLADQPLDVIEKNRKAVGSAFADPGLASIRDAGEKALSAIYSPLREDIAAFVKSRGGAADLVKWEASNKQLASMAGDLKDTALKRVLTKGDETPETVRSMLFSQKPSDMNRLYQALPEKGRASARTAIIQEAVAKSGGMEGLSPERFKNALDRMSKQVGVFFRGEDFEAADGLLKALKLTEHAAKAGAAPLTGAQNVPAVLTLLISSMFGGSIPATATALGTVGGIARIYEATGVRTALRRLSKTQNPKAQANILKSLEAALKDAGVPTGQSAAQSANSDMPPIRRVLP